MISLAVLAVAFLVAQDSAAERYAWPLNLPRVLTSSFAEFRPGRFHMGIDLRTGPIGQDVFAAGDGFISRVRCSPYGYGKAVYLTLHDGNTVVYGHLNDYMPELRDYVRAAQHRAEDYTVDLYPDANDFPVVRGQLLAKSGQTGVGVPHLHYEFRDGSGSPINPRLLGIDWPDTTAPQIRRVAVFPRDPASRINGDVVPVILDAQPTGANGFRTDAIRARGDVAFAVDVVDPANGGSTRLGVYTVDAIADGQPLFRIVHDSVSYDHQNDGIVAYHPYLDGRFLVQWRWPGNRSSIYGGFPGDGWLSIPETGAEVSISAADFHANAATVTIPIAFENPIEDLALDGATSKSGRVEFETFGEYLVVTVRFDAPEAETPMLVSDAPASKPVPFLLVNPKTFRAAYAAPDGIDYVVLRMDHPRIDAPPADFYILRRGGKPLGIKRDGVEIMTRANSVYGVQFLQLRAATAPTSPGFRPVGPAIEIWPSEAPLDAEVTLSFPAGLATRDSPRPLICRRRGDSWSAVATVRDGGSLRTDVQSFGVYAVMEDIAPPVISNIQPASGSVINTSRPVIRALLADQGSGIDSFRVTCNGKWLLTAYDPEEGTLVWEQDEELAGGDIELVFELSDRAGNRSMQTRHFSVSASTNASPNQ